MPKDRPILFSGPMVRAILQGLKTQTRRVMKPQPYRDCISVQPLGDEWVQELTDGEGKPFVLTNVNQRLRCPHGVPGDRLWVRETFVEASPDWAIDVPFVYRSDHIDPRGDAGPIRWRPSIHMPRWASRILLEITNIRVERLQKITLEHIEAEGFVDQVGNSHDFMNLWDSLNAAKGHGWDANPWVWVVEFKKVEAPR